MATVRYGIDCSVRLELAEDVFSAECGQPRQRPLDDIRTAVVDALSHPLEYPPLGRITTPGDRVVVALGEGIPQAAQISAAVVCALVDARVEPDGIAVLRTRADCDSGVGDPRAMLEAPLGERITLLTHDAGNRKGLAYLAATEAGEPILLNRAIHEADLVLPIGCLRDPSAAGYFGIHDVIFPNFSDRATLQRFRALEALGAATKTRKALVRDVEHVAWLLGINFTVQLVPASGFSVLNVLAGQSDAVRRRGRQLYRAAWKEPVPRRASLVVAAIEGDRNQQTWDNFGRALHAAAAVVEDGGSIAVCCELAAAPGPAMQRMAGARSRGAALRRIRKDRPSDALPAAQLARALDRGKVYLLSRLDPSAVEDLEMIHLAAGDELARLARLHKSCILLANAPQTVVTLADDDRP